MSDALEEYRKGLITAEQKAQADFDKTVLTLSGGALGVSFAFVKQFVVEGVAVAPRWLVAAWTAWTLSAASVLASQYFSTLAMRRTLHQVDTGAISAQRPGGWYDRAVVVLNAAGGIGFVLGVVLAGVFVFRNVR